MSNDERCGKVTLRKRIRLALARSTQRLELDASNSGERSASDCASPQGRPLNRMDDGGGANGGAGGGIEEVVEKMDKCMICLITDDQLMALPCHEKSHKACYGCLQLMISLEKTIKCYECREQPASDGVSPQRRSLNRMADIGGAEDVAEGRAGGGAAGGAAGKAAGEAAGGAAEVANCMICCDRKDQILALPCHESHKACRDCLLKVMIPIGKTIKCLECRKVSPWVNLDRLKIDGENVSDFWKCTMCEEGNPAVHYCYVCTEKLCEACFENHQSYFKGSRTHRCSPFLEYRNAASKIEQRRCGEDGHSKEELRIACKACNLTACFLCGVEPAECDRGGKHSFTSIDNQFQKVKKELGALKVAALAKRTKLSDYLKETEESMAVFKGISDSLTCDLIQVHAHRMKQLNTEFKQLVKTVEDTLEKQTKEVEALQAQYIDREVEIQNLHDALEAVLESAHPAQLLTEKESIEKHLAAGLNFDLEDIVIPDYPLTLKKSGDKGSRGGATLSESSGLMGVELVSSTLAPDSGAIPDPVKHVKPGERQQSITASGGITIDKMDIMHCPNCQAGYILMRGGCAHIRCSACKHEFCPGCDSKYERRAFVHEWNCYTELRDVDIYTLEGFLKQENVRVSEGLVAADHCEVLITEDDDLFEDKETPCGRPVYRRGIFSLFRNNTQYCEGHFQAYLIKLINDNGLNPALIVYPENQKKSIAKLRQYFRKHNVAFNQEEIEEHVKFTEVSMSSEERRILKKMHVLLQGCKLKDLSGRPLMHIVKNFFY